MLVIRTALIVGTGLLNIATQLTTQFSRYYSFSLFVLRSGHARHQDCPDSWNSPGNRSKVVKSWKSRT
ncbi:hypothetical protein DY000_02062357 [Brassica cretica]|uniref:Secreted protein n=1 Tax=Brassica cretica TaxID=69181 RepID=A0ABQ7AVT5_BRACR|nr:hypothetical protein DY000_02062357 [Brassica cretica]